MLFEKKYSEGDVVSLKLTSGEEVIGRFVKEDMTSVTLERPSMIAMTPKGPGMAPVMFTVNQESSLTFNKSTVMITANSLKDIADQYVFQTTGIQPVSAGSIVTG
jgi:hypothetical protein